MNIKVIIISALFLCSGLQAQEAGSMEFLHEATSANAIEVAIKTVKGLFKKRTKKLRPSFSDIKKVHVIKTGAAFFAAWWLGTAFFQKKQVAIENSDVAEDSDITTTNTEETITEAPAA